MDRDPHGGGGHSGRTDFLRTLSTSAAADLFLESLSAAVPNSRRSPSTGSLFWSLPLTSQVNSGPPLWTHQGWIPASVLACPTALDHLVPSGSLSLDELLIQDPPCSFLISQPSGQAGLRVFGQELTAYCPHSCGLSTPVVKVLVESAQIHSPEIGFGSPYVPWATVAMVFCRCQLFASLHVSHLVSRMVQDLSWVCLSGPSAWTLWLAW